MKNTPIKENHLFQKAYRNGKSQAGKYVAVYTLPDRQSHRFMKADPCHRPLNRLGLTTGKKIGGATVRSRARRLMREAYRLIEAENEIVYGNLLVIAARARIADAKMQDVKRDLTKCLKQLGLIKKPTQKDEIQ
ncbi:MAG: ribonuclease P protein component [Clostridia bacterium]|nr:ribonuclease P protein component [Clostridia bacterium]